MSGTVINRALYKLAEYGVRRLRARFEFRVELHADVKLVFGDFNRFNKSAVRRGTRNYHSRFFDFFAEVVVEFVSVAVTFRNAVLAVARFHYIPQNLAGIRTQTHCSAHLNAVLVGHQIYYAVF